MTDTIEAVLRGRGYVVSRNKPYAGGFITEHYGNPAAGLHSMQLEVNRALYMDERRFERSAAFPTVARDLEDLADAAHEHSGSGAAALPGGRRIASCCKQQSRCRCRNRRQP